MEIRALRERGWKISAIAHHEEYVPARFVDDHTIWLTALFDDVIELGYPVAKHYGVVIEPCPPRRGNRRTD